MKLNSILAGLAATAALALGGVQAEGAQGGGNLVDVAISVNTQGPYAGSFDTLIAALQAADPVVLQILSGTENYTVFAPTDAAFAALGLDETNIGTLPQNVLTTVLAYHVAPGLNLSPRVVNAERMRMVAGRYVTKQSGSTALVDRLGRVSNIIVPDVVASNGVIHVVDGVLLPLLP
jgi:uncharacterized surface protein with fasciclin (FAS1) repeats